MAFKQITAAVAAAAILSVGSGQFVGEAAAHGKPYSYADLAEQLTPAVVNISTAQRQPGARARGELAPLQRKFGNNAVSLGSGFIIDPKGVIVTNNHVVRNADEITVKLSDGREYKATVRAADSETDLAVLMLEGVKGRLPSVQFGDAHKARVGDRVLAIGNPFGLGGTVTEGIISARNRDIDAGNFDDFIQTDAAINRGNSGGPLFDMEGKVVGVNTAIYSQTGGSVGVGFAIPADLAKIVVSQLIEYGETRRGWLGVSIDELSAERARQLGMERPQGAIVTVVRKNSPALSAGVEPEDIILSFNRRSISNVRDLTRAVAETPVGTTVPMVIIRDGARITLKVKVDRREDRVLASIKSNLPQRAGLTLQKATPELTEAFDLPTGTEGVIVTDVDPNSPAAIVLQPGDVILEIGWERMMRPEAAIEKLDKLRNLNSGPVQIYVQRGDLLFYESLRP